MPEPWWTEADQAELDVAIWATVTAAEECPACLGAVTGLLVDWFEMRQLVSKAEWLRRRHLLTRLSEMSGPKPEGGGKPLRSRRANHNGRSSEVVT